MSGNGIDMIPSVLVAVLVRTTASTTTYVDKNKVNLFRVAFLLLIYAVLFGSVPLTVVALSQAIRGQSGWRSWGIAFASLVGSAASTSLGGSVPPSAVVTFVARDPASPSPIESLPVNVPQAPTAIAPLAKSQLRAADRIASVCT